MFPDELFDQYEVAMVKFKKAQKALFRRFGSNLAELSDELGLVLAPKFDNSDLSEYAGQCWMAACKCEQDLENKVSAVDYLIKAGNAFVRADERARQLFPGLNDGSANITGAVRCFNDALALLGTESAMSAGIIRQLKKISNEEKNSNFLSSTHRIHDLEASARLHIQSGRFITALEQLTEIFDILQEDKTEEFYRHTLGQIEVLILLLLLLLDLPPGRQSPIHMKIMNKYSPDNRNILKEKISPSMTNEFLLALQNLSCACCDQSDDCRERESNVSLARHEVLSAAGHHSITSSSTRSQQISHEHEVLLEELATKFK